MYIDSANQTSTWKLEHELLTNFSTQQSAPSCWWFFFLYLEKYNGERRSTNWEVHTVDENSFKFATIHKQVTVTTLNNWHLLQQWHVFSGEEMKTLLFDKVKFSKATSQNNTPTNYEYSNTAPWFAKEVKVFEASRDFPSPFSFSKYFRTVVCLLYPPSKCMAQDTWLKNHENWFWIYSMISWLFITKPKFVAVKSVTFFP